MAIDWITYPACRVGLRGPGVNCWWAPTLLYLCRCTDGACGSAAIIRQQFWQRTLPKSPESRTGHWYWCARAALQVRVKCLPQRQGVEMYFRLLKYHWNGVPNCRDETFC